MYDQIIVQAEVDYRRERNTVNLPASKRRAARTRTPLLGRAARRVR